MRFLTARGLSHKPYVRGLGVLSGHFRKLTPLSFYLTRKNRHDLLNINEGSHLVKTVLLCSILFCVIAMPALGELTDADLDKIRLIVKEEINTDREDFEKDIKEYIDIKIESIEKRLSLVTTLIVGLMALIGIPLVALTVMIGWRSIKDNSQGKKIDNSAPEVKITQAFTPSR